MLWFIVSIRPYWVGVLAVAVGLLVVWRRLRNPWVLAAVVAGLLVALEVVFLTVSGDHLNQGREQVLSRLTPESAMPQPFDVADSGTALLGLGNSVSALANTALALGFLVLPVPLLLDPSPLYLAAAVWITLYYWQLWRGLRRSADPSFTWLDRLPLAIPAAFLVVGALFEPDFGSYMRHLAPLVLLVLLGLARTGDRPHSVSRAREGAGRGSPG
jgi:hypothetical protein